MGLDMYLEKRTYIKNWSYDGAEQYETIVTKNKKKVEHIHSDRVKYVIEEVGYWRKFNALHYWFVKNVQEGKDDCEEYYVSNEKFKELLTTLKRIDLDNSLAEELMPTKPGFLFGGYEYDEWYFQDVKNTIKIVDNILREIESARKKEDYTSIEYLYRSSW